MARNIPIGYQLLGCGRDKKFLWSSFFSKERLLVNLFFKEIANLKAAFAMRIMNNFMDVMGLATLVAFTFVIILIALLSQGALIYYYEPTDSLSQCHFLKLDWWIR